MKLTVKNVSASPYILRVGGKHMLEPGAAVEIETDDDGKSAIDGNPALVIVAKAKPPEPVEPVAPKADPVPEAKAKPAK